MSHSAPTDRAPLIEIFTSIQGEGRFVGQPMVFVRTATCPIRCDYCDTQNSYAAGGLFPVEGVTESEPNPVFVPRAAELVLASWAASPLGGQRAPIVTVTGGEPLVFPGFVRGLTEALGPDVRVHLETAALDPVALASLADSIDHLSADHKLPSALQGQDHGEAHAECVRLALAAGRSVDLKFVLTSDSTGAEFQAGLSRHQPHPDLRIVIQPATPQTDAGRSIERPDPRVVTECMSAALQAGFEAVVIPQLHPLLGVR